MTNRINKQIRYYKAYFKHHVLVIIAMKIGRVALFPIALLIKLYRWTYNCEVI